MTAKQAKFQLEFMLFLRIVGRTKESNEALEKVFEYLEEQIAKETADVPTA